MTKLLSLGDESKQKLKDISHVLGFSESMTTRIAIALLYKRISKDFKGIEDLLTDD